MNLDYKESESNNFGLSHEQYAEIMSIEDTNWIGNPSEGFQENNQIPEEQIISLAQDFDIFGNENSSPEDIQTALFEINTKINENPNLIHHIEYPPSTIPLLLLLIIERISNENEPDKEERNVINTSIQLLKHFLFNLSFPQDFIIEHQIDKFLITYIKSPYLAYQNVADLIEMMSFLLTSFDNDFLAKFIDLLACEGYLSALCDIFSFLHSQKNSRRKAPSLSELPYKSIGINLQHGLLLFPVLLFAFQYFKSFDKIGYPKSIEVDDTPVMEEDYPDYELSPNSGKFAPQYNVTEELIEDLLAMFTLDLPEKETCLLLNTIAHVSIIFNRYYLRAAKAIGTDVFNKIVKFAALQFDGQVYALQILINTIIYDENLSFVLKTEIPEAVFSLIHQEPIDLTILKKLIITVQYMAQTIAEKQLYTRYEIFTHEHIVETLHLRFFNFLYMEGSYEMRHYSAMVFINLLKNHYYHLPILTDPEIDIIRIFTSFFLTGQKRFIREAKSTLLDIIQSPDNHFFLEPLYQGFVEDGVFEAFDDPDSSDVNIYQYIMEIKQEIENELEIEDGN